MVQSRPPHLLGHVFMPSFEFVPESHVERCWIMLVNCQATGATWCSSSKIEEDFEITQQCGCANITAQMRGLRSAARATQG